MTEYAIPVKTKTVHSISWGDLENLVNDTYFADVEPDRYGQNRWDFVANEECGNDSDHEFSTEREIDEYGQEYLNKFRGGDVWACQFRTDLILTDLANQGLIPHGDILVWVSW